MTRLTLLLSITVPAIALAACLPDYDYDGDYAMTYTVLTGTEATAAATAGTTDVHIREGFGGDVYRLDLGPSFCQLTGVLQPESYGDVPFLAIDAQPCWHGDAALSLAGTAAWDHDAKHLTIELAGSTLAAGNKPGGATTVQLTDTW